MQRVTKKIFLNALTCPSLGWQMRNGTCVTRELTPGEQFRIAEGVEIGRRAQGLFPHGLLIEEKDPLSAARRTAQVMNDTGVSAIFEAVFLHGQCIAKADILQRGRAGWHMIEVKSGLNERERFLDDLAYTAAVMEGCGIPVARYSLYLLSRSFRLGMNGERLFLMKDHTRRIRRRLKHMKQLLREVETITGPQGRPSSDLIMECRRCQLFRECTGKDIVHPIFDLPRLSQRTFRELKEGNIACVEDIPPTFHLTGKQMRVRKCVLEKKPWISSGLKRDLDAVAWPASYLDFEVVSTAVPLYPDIGPYTPVPTQYSIHRCPSPGQIAGHAEYLADPDRDCRRELAGRLIEDLRGEGSIIAYSGFEKNILSGLERVFPHLSTELHTLSERIVDLEKIISRGFYHPGFHGGTSIKRTLPVLVPELSYDNLEIADGSSAIAAFASLARGQDRKTDKLERMKRNLLEYCRRDTLAMVKMHDYLLKVVKDVL